jgi:VIT family
MLLECNGDEAKYILAVRKRCFYDGAHRHAQGTSSHKPRRLVESFRPGRERWIPLDFEPCTWFGVAAARGTHGSILIAGTAGLVAGAMSMAAGEYVSVHS